MPRRRRGGLRGDWNVQVIIVQVNGKPVELDGETRMLDYIEKLGVNPRAIAVEHNGAILERSVYEAVTLRDGDTLEIVRMVGGGVSTGD
jgi:sulfur carrier protein